MKAIDLNGKYASGQKVFALKKPEQMLVIRRYYGRIYYCNAVSGEDGEYAYFESEINAIS
ncbi:hypothetical protein [Dyadobacter sp. Leaf189]|uniref:hypothetical protein n=1 Tax=Dyadobacter sp. Leaf189 TaxID=1736295 RepID=UPI0006FEEED2|nr:hypothetical protein [Dyadobacter sp. Leaf189]KQS27646.1 hypothetical protein ASG33_14495 [Dyadobacter sp. Leaf189]